MAAQAYLGTKVVLAEPMDSDTFMATVRPIPNFPAGPPSSPGYRVVYEDGYVSWSPKATFERAYRLLTGAELNLIENPGLLPGVVKP